MRHISSLIAAASAIIALTADAQPTPRPAKPYTPVAITLPAASTDASFATFRAKLIAVAKSRVYVALGQLVQSQGFFWDRDFAHTFDPRRPAVDNLAAAIRLEHENGAGWDALAAFAAEASVEPLTSRPGIVCAPARPSYDGVAFARLLDATYTRPVDWAYPRAVETPVCAAPRPQAEVVGMHSLHFIRLLGFEGPDSEPAPGRSRWVRVGMPDAKTGYVAPGSLMSLTAERLCYIHNLVGGWRIVGFVAAGE